MHYIFFDESKFPDNKGMLTCAVIVPQDRYSQLVKTVAFQSWKGRLEKIDEFLGTVKGLAAVCQVDFKLPWLAENAQDSCNDVSRMSRIDNVWSWAVSYAVMIALIEQEKRRNEISTVDIYHDPKSLTTEHLTALHDLIRDKMTREIFQRLHKLQGVASGLRNTMIGRIEPVSKPKTVPADRFQRGVWLCDQIMRVPEGWAGCKNIKVWDITSYIESTVGRWQSGQLV